MEKIKKNHEKEKFTGIPQTIGGKDILMAIVYDASSNKSAHDPVYDPKPGNSEICDLGRY